MQKVTKYSGKTVTTTITSRKKRQLNSEMSAKPKLFKSVTKFKYTLNTVTNQNCIQGDAKSRLLMLRNISSEISNQTGVHSSVFHTAAQNVGNDAFCELCEYAIGQSRPNLYPGERVSSKCMTRKTNMEAPRRKVQ